MMGKSPVLPGSGRQRNDLEHSIRQVGFKELRNGQADKLTNKMSYSAYGRFRYISVIRMTTKPNHPTERIFLSLATLAITNKLLYQPLPSTR